MGDFCVALALVEGQIDSSDGEAVFEIQGNEGDLLNLRIVAAQLVAFGDGQRQPFTLSVENEYGYLIDYYGVGALNTRGNMRSDPQIYDLRLPENGNFYVTVSWSMNSSPRNYELLIYRFDGPFLLGDINSDQAVDFRDIVPFIAAVSSGEFTKVADINEDGSVDFSDITPFIRLVN